MAALLAFFLLISYYINNRIDTRLIQAETLANRIVYSDTIMQQDPTLFRTYAGIVNLEKINDTLIEQSLSYTPTRHAAAKIKIISKPQSTGTEVFIKEAYLNRKQFNDFYVMIRSGIQGSESAIQAVKKFPVTCYDKDISPPASPYYYCTLVVEVMIPNT